MTESVIQSVLQRVEKRIKMKASIVILLLCIALISLNSTECQESTPKPVIQLGNVGLPQIGLNPDLPPIIGAGRRKRGSGYN